MPLYTRITAVYPAHRAVITGAAALTYIVTPSWSVLGQPFEAHVVCTALLVGELLGYTWEHTTRNLVRGDSAPYKLVPPQEPRSMDVSG